MPRRIGQGLCAEQSEKFLRGLKLAPNFSPNYPTPPIGESEYLNILGDLENFTVVSIRIPPRHPIRESEDLDVLEDLENFAIAVSEPNAYQMSV